MTTTTTTAHDHGSWPRRAARSWRRLRRRALDVLDRALQARPTRRITWAGPVPVTYVIWNAFSVGGTVRTVLRQAEGLLDQGHQVTVVSVLRHPSQEHPFFDVDPRLNLEVLVDRHRLATTRTPLGRLRRWLDGKPRLTSQFSIGREQQASLLVDLTLLHRLIRARGVVVGTRVGVNLAIARFAHPRATKVAQEHLHLDHYERAVRSALLRHAPRLDAIACLTEADANTYRDALGDDAPTVIVLPNPIPDQLPRPASRQRPRIVSVGRLAASKGFDQLITAFAQVADAHPDWELRIVGSGPWRGRLEEQVRGLGLEDRITIAPETKDVAGELAAASVFGLSARHEGFGIVLLEAMAAGLPVVSMASPQGPRELLRHERNALVTPPGDVAAFAGQLDRLLRDPVLQGQLAHAGRRFVTRFTTSTITARWSQLLEELARGRPSPTVTPADRSGAHRRRPGSRRGSPVASAG
ncbi:MAG: glycosyltransferase family 4 protein [Nitriliruptoraceae bacterium]